jgi:hypothetical protein
MFDETKDHQEIGGQDEGENSHGRGQGKWWHLQAHAGDSESIVRELQNEKKWIHWRWQWWHAVTHFSWHADCRLEDTFLQVKVAERGCRALMRVTPSGCHPPGFYIRCKLQVKNIRLNHIITLRKLCSQIMEIAQNLMSLLWQGHNNCINYLYDMVFFYYKLHVWIF